MIRSLLFIPGSTPNKLIHIPFMGADAIILDLEDAVSPDEKDAARILVRNTLHALQAPKPVIVVRINSIDTAYWQDDLSMIAPLCPDLIMPPKVSSAEDVRILDEYICKLERENELTRDCIGLLPLIETALGVENAFSIASACARVKGMLLGGEDLSADLQCKRTKAGDEIQYARSRIVCAARAAGVEAYDTPFTDVNDDDGLLLDAQKAKSLGFSGKSAIAPRHVAFINEAFSPSAADIDHARQVLAAIEQAKATGAGVVALHGKMIDAPVVARANRVMDAARALGLDGEA